MIDEPLAGLLGSSNTTKHTARDGLAAHLVDHFITRCIWPTALVTGNMSVDDLPLRLHGEGQLQLAGYGTVTLQVDYGHIIQTGWQGKVVRGLILDAGGSIVKEVRCMIFCPPVLRAYISIWLALMGTVAVRCGSGNAVVDLCPGSGFVHF